jgi:hypothetical protein
VKYEVWWCSTKYLLIMCVLLSSLHRASSSGSSSSSSSSQSSTGVGADSSSSDADTDDADMLWGHELRQNDVGFEISLEQQVSSITFVHTRLCSNSLLMYTLRYLSGARSCKQCCNCGQLRANAVSCAIPTAACLMQQLPLVTCIQ